MLTVLMCYLIFELIMCFVFTEEDKLKCIKSVVDGQITGKVG